MQRVTKQKLLTGALVMLLTDIVLAAPIFTPNSQPTGWLSRPAVTFFDLSSGTESFYQIDFRKDSWAGNVLAKDINNIAVVQTTGPWDNADPTVTTAASLLDLLNYNTDRKIATLGGPFRWANLSGAQQTALGSEKHLNFVRGDRSNEEPNGLAFYQRASTLADILHSNIYYWDDGTNKSLYIGANDGMLHSFDAITGAENWAYVPSMVIENLAELTDKTYVHTHFVDGPISIANMVISGTQKAILVGALGAGGKGLYALDITTQTAADETAVANKVLWEITATGDFADLGHTFGTPVLTKLANGTAVVIVGNGYVNTGNGHAVLYIINALTGALVTAIDTGSGSAASPNGLSSPTLYDSDGDSKPDVAYAGDIDGNMWKFDLSSNTASLIFATSPAQAITTAPVVRPHFLGGQIVNFATGRILTSGDTADTSVNHVYGIWDGAPAANDTLLIQNLTDTTYGSDQVRTVSNNIPDWTPGSGHHKGWKVALPPGERVVGEKPIYNNGRFYFLSTNPTIELGANWIHELVFNTGGSPNKAIFDLNEDGEFDSSDYALNGGIPVAKYLGQGIFSQPLLVNAVDIATTLYAFHPDLPISDGVPSDPDDPGVSGGHFDFDIYYYGPEVTQTEEIPITPPDSMTAIICKKTNDVAKKLDSVDKICKDHSDLDGTYTYLTDYTTGAVCNANDDPDKVEYYQTLTCNRTVNVEITSADYKKIKHVHEYDDKYDVTGVNMLNASLIDFNLINAITDTTVPFKILVMNQYLNPAAKLSVGGAEFETVQTYEDLASKTNAAALLAGLPIYTQDNIQTLIFNLPLDAFKSKDWWENGGAIRAGLIPTKTGCVNGVNTDGVQNQPGPNGERFNGALAFQLIKPDTPFTELELNGPDVTYGWRVKIENFKDWVLAEYTTFWHHPNGECYGDPGWVPDPPEDFDSSAKTVTRAPGSADPTDGIFGLAITSVTVVVNADGSTTTTATFSDGTTHIKIVTENADGSTTIYQKFRDGTEETVTIYPGDGDGGAAGFVDPNTGSPLEELETVNTGRQTWRDEAN